MGRAGIAHAQYACAHNNLMRAFCMLDRGGTKVKTTSRGRATGKDGAVFGGGSVQETVQGTDETHGAQVSRQELLQTQL